MIWNQDTVEVDVVKPGPIDVDELDDGRCKASTWRVKRPAKPRYENHFGPGGFNRCIGDDGHANPLHKDEWGHVFRAEPFHVVRIEQPA